MPVQVARDIDIGGRTLHLFCMGTAPEGTPTVLAESGLTGDSRVWNDQFYAVAGRTRLCAYDRAGLNLSQAAPAGTRTTADQVDDLEKLLAAADINGPLLFLGHSSGAWNVILFASRHPDEVAGVVLADPRGPGVSAAWLKALPEERPDEPVTVRTNRDDLTGFEHDPSANQEHLDLAASAAQASEAVDAAGPLFGSHPLIVLRGALTPAMWDQLPEPTRGDFTRIWFAEQDELVEESTNGRLETLPDSDHDLPGYRPDAVTAAIFEILDSIKGM